MFGGLKPTFSAGPGVAQRVSVWLGTKLAEFGIRPHPYLVSRKPTQWVVTGGLLFSVELFFRGFEAGRRRVVRNLRGALLIGIGKERGIEEVDGQSCFLLGCGCETGATTK